MVTYLVNNVTSVPWE